MGLSWIAGCFTKVLSIHSDLRLSAAAKESCWPAWELACLGQALGLCGETSQGHRHKLLGGAVGTTPVPRADFSLSFSSLSSL